ncbi:DUF4190 domain-containing protein [Glutamicibacter endophyticus]|uniref:DUF4190 domain-containing protein n=1 Tax=Glutamicibacter endophyticus TaxID=1522174 RepID=UPI003AEF8986
MSYYPYPMNQPQRPEPTGLSVASLVLGLVSMVGLFIIILVPLAGVITGHLAYRREPAGRSLSLPGLITSWVGVGLALLCYAFFFWMFWAMSTTFFDFIEYYDDYEGYYQYEDYGAEYSFLT